MRVHGLQVTDEELGVMDQTAITLCKENNIPVIVFDAMTRDNILRAAMGEDVGTVVCHHDSELDAAAPALPRIRISPGGADGGSDTEPDA